MKFKLGEIKNCEKAFEQISTFDLDIESTVEITDFIDVVSKELMKIEKFRNKLVEKFGKLNDETKKIEVYPGTPEYEILLFNYNKLLNIEVDLNFKPIDRNMFLKNNCKMKPLYNQQLKKFFSDYRPLELVENYDIDMEITE